MNATNKKEVQGETSEYSDNIGDNPLHWWRQYDGLFCDGMNVMVCNWR